MHRRLVRNLISVLSICLLMALLTIAVTAFSEEYPVVTVQSAVVHRGQRFTLDVTLTDSQGFVGLFLTVNYDADVFTLVGYERGDALGNMQLTTTNPESQTNGTFRFLWDSSKADFSCGRLVTLIFDSNVESPAADYEIDIEYSPNGTLSDYGKPQRLTVQNGVVTLVKGKYSVNYVNHDGSLLQHSEYNEDEVPSYKGKAPTRFPDSKYIYRWTGKWQSVLSEESDVLVLEPMYKQIPQQYQVLYYVADSVNASPQLKVEYSGFVGYGQNLDLPSPQKDGYVFSGWYEDIDYNQRFSSVSMPDCDLQLFGYFVVALRETAPLFYLNCESQTDDKVVLELSVAENYGLSAVSLNLSYDTSVFSLAQVNKEQALSSAEFSYNDNSGKLKLVWQNSANDYSEGKAISLVFDVKRQAKSGGYDFLLTYNEKSDAIYFDTNGNLWYTKLRLFGCNVAVGNSDGWFCRLQNGVWAQGRLSDFVPSNVKMSLVDISDEVTLSKKASDKLSTDGATACSAYTISFTQNGSDYSLPCKVKIKLHVTSLQLTDGIALYKLDENGVTPWEFVVNEDHLDFVTDGSSDWLIARCDKNGGAVIVCILSGVIAAVLCLTVVAIAKKKKSLRKTKEVQNDNSEYDS